MSKISLREKLAQFSEYWKPKIVAELNGQHVKLVKFRGEFVWHYHEAEDELFLVVAGRFRMEFRDRHEWIEQGECIVVPRGVEHRPVAEEEVSVLLFEPASTLNTGNIRGDLTTSELEKLSLGFLFCEKCVVSTAPAPQTSQQTRAPSKETLPARKSLARL